MHRHNKKVAGLPTHEHLSIYHLQYKRVTQKFQVDFNTQVGEYTLLNVLSVTLWVFLTHYFVILGSLPASEWPIKQCLFNWWQLFHCFYIKLPKLHELLGYVQEYIWPLYLTSGLLLDYLNKCKALWCLLTSTTTTQQTGHKWLASVQSNPTCIFHTSGIIPNSFLGMWDIQLSGSSVCCYASQSYPASITSKHAKRGICSLFRGRWYPG